MSDQPDDRDRVERAHDHRETPADADEADDQDEADEVDEEELREQQQEAARERAERARRQDIEEASQDREGDALEQENPNYHRDEAPENS